MITLNGTYQNGKIKLERELRSKKTLKVIVTFLEDVEESNGMRLNLSDFSFSKSQKLLEDVKNSFTDTLIEERRRES